MVLYTKDTVDDQIICEMCHELQKKILKQHGRKQRQDQAPAKDKAPLAACGAEKLRATVRAQRLHCKDLEAKVKDLQVQIEKHGVSVSESLEKDLLTIMSGQNLEATPHMRFFWEQQMHLMWSTKMGRRYHPQMIRFALSIHCKSPSAYRELRDSGALILPSERRGGWTADRKASWVMSFQLHVRLQLCVDRREVNISLAKTNARFGQKCRN